MVYDRIRVKNHSFIPDCRMVIHRYNAMEAMGRVLAAKYPVHHVDCDKRNCNNTNLIVCEDERYHSLLHRRTEALLLCGDANKRRCSFCGEWDAPENMYSQPNGQGARHRECFNKYCRQRNKA